jgi:predicted RecA/RadA family phage recombinase
MATNRVRADGFHISAACTHPAAPVTGDPVRIGAVTGVALTDEGEGGNIATECSIDLSPSVWDVVVDDDATTGVTLFQTIYYHDTQTGTPATSLNNVAAGANGVFGIALETLAANATGRINVLHLPQIP